jgi:retron-type reverse transcriptase
VVQAALKEILEPIFDPTFSEHSYGFRPGRNQQQAVQAAKKIVSSGKEFVVDIDLAKFFDKIHHDRLIARLGQRINDKRILRIIGMTLRSGVMTCDGMVRATEEDCGQE